MHHMQLAVAETNVGKDPRVKDAILNFIYVMMEMYKKDFRFNTDEHVYGCPMSAMMKKGHTGQIWFFPGAICHRKGDDLFVAFVEIAAACGFFTAQYIHDVMLAFPFRAALH